jgi:hypothetical protein
MIDWLAVEFGYLPTDVLPNGLPEQAAPLVAAVLISSAYFHLR